jgi:hypothetical protein
MYVFIDLNKYTYMYIYKDINMNKYIEVYMHIYTHIYTYLSKHLYLYIYIYMEIYRYLKYCKNSKSKYLFGLKSGSHISMFFISIISPSK